MRNPQRTMKTTIEREMPNGDYAEINVEVEYDYTPGYEGCWYRSNGDPGDPPEPATLDIVGVTADGVEIELTAEEEKRLEEACWDEMSDNYESLNCDASDRDYED